MNRYPLWKFAIMAVVLLVAVLYAAPNFFGEYDAVQVSSARTGQQADSDTQSKVTTALAAANIQALRLSRQNHRIMVLLASTDEQLHARQEIEKALNPDPANPAWVVALNRVTRTPAWMQSLNALPMYLGLDLRGGVHFMLQVDMVSALQTRAESIAGEMRAGMREHKIRHSGIKRDGQNVEVAFSQPGAEQAFREWLVATYANTLQVHSLPVAEGQIARLRMSFTPEAAKREQATALKKNIETLHNRVNELGVAEPVIQQQGLDRIVVQLPGVQDTARAKGILGRTATLEMRLVDESVDAATALGAGTIPFGSERFMNRDGAPIILKRDVIVTGNDLSDAQPGFDSQTKEPIVSLSMNSRGGNIMREVSRNNINKRMAIVLFEKGKGLVITAPAIRGELGSHFQISGQMTTAETADLSLLLRAGSLAAPMEIIEERTVGPSLGAENIAMGFHSVLWGFLAVVLFMVVYYYVFGIISSVALAVNLFMLVALLSMLQATLTLPGMAAMALALGMAIDSNVLINERIREELRNGAPPQQAMQKGYEHAWGTIFDSNITTLIAGIALLAFGSGPVRGFAVVHCLGILTSMFSAVFFSRGLVNLYYGYRRRLSGVSIGTVWRPTTAGRVAGRGSATSSATPPAAATPPSKTV